MRILCTFKDQQQGQLFSSFLLANGIENQLELDKETDWGSVTYGDVTSKIWVIEEDDYEKAATLLTEFENDPHNPRYLNQKNDEMPLIEPIESIKDFPPPFRNRGPSIPTPQGTYWTIFLISLCSFFLFINTLTTPMHVSNTPAFLSNTALYTSPLYKALMYDYPQAFEWLDQFVQQHGIEKLQDLKLEVISPEGIGLLEKYKSARYWKGLYHILLIHLQNPNLSWSTHAPLFEKIRQGEIWRTFTPALLHYDIFHLFFNMIWLLVLGRQMETKLGTWRYLLFILLTGIFSNTAQYLVGGFSFLGFSGILCAMLTFIWVRKKDAAWEGYQLQSSTFGFMVLFIFVMFAIQVGSFFLEAYLHTAIPSGIANTAHLSGGLLGIFLGKLNFFSIKNR